MHKGSSQAAVCLMDKTAKNRMQRCSTVARITAGLSNCVAPQFSLWNVLKTRCSGFSRFVVVLVRVSKFSWGAFMISPEMYGKGGFKPLGLYRRWFSGSKSLFIAQVVCVQRNSNSFLPTFRFFFVPNPILLNHLFSLHCSQASDHFFMSLDGMWPQ